jgi:pimeloyl-ACP methyl ester carboxylesterase
MNAGIEDMIENAYFISPMVDMEKMIFNLMQWSGVTEEELKSHGKIPTSFGEDLSWNYLCYVREHPLNWNVPTKILYGSNDNLTSFETMSNFAKKHNAELTVMENGEHWFHTEEQMKFLDEWILNQR